MSVMRHVRCCCCGNCERDRGSRTRMSVEWGSVVGQYMECGETQSAAQHDVWRPWCRPDVLVIRASRILCSTLMLPPYIRLPHAPSPVRRKEPTRPGCRDTGLALKGCHAKPWRVIRKKKKMLSLLTYMILPPMKYEYIVLWTYIQGRCFPIHHITLKKRTKMITFTFIKMKTL